MCVSVLCRLGRPARAVCVTYGWGRGLRPASTNEYVREYASGVYVFLYCSGNNECVYIFRSPVNFVLLYR